MAKKPRDTFKYEVRVGRKKVHGGITNNLDTKVGNKTTREGALKWEREKGYSANSD